MFMNCKKSKFAAIVSYKLLKGYSLMRHKFLFCLIALSFLILNISIGASSEVSPSIIIRTGESVDLGNGWTLEAKQVDVDNEKVWLELNHDEYFLDNAILDLEDRRVLMEVIFF